MNDQSAATHRGLSLPVLHYAYALICICSALLTATGGYRAVVDFLLSASLPEHGVSFLAGVFQLVWNDLAYLIGKPLKSVGLYGILPFLGAGLNILAAALLFLRKRAGTYVTFANISFGILTAVAAIVTLIRWGEPDSWRVVALTSYLCCNIAWLAYFRASLRRQSAGRAQTSGRR